MPRVKVRALGKLRLSRLEFGRLQQNARLLAVCRDYVEAARLGYPDGFWWQTLLNLSTELGVSPSSGIVPVSASDRVPDCIFLFLKNGKRLGVIACDEILGDQKWLEETATSARKDSGSEQTGKRSSNRPNRKWKRSQFPTRDQWGVGC